MPGNGSFQVKCEPPSDEEDSYHQPSDHLQNIKLFLDYRNIKVEKVGRNDENTSADLLQHLQASSTLEELAPLAPAGPAAIPVCVKQEPADTPALMLETLESSPHTATGSSIIERHNMAMLNSAEELDSSHFTPLLVKDELSSEREFQHVSSDETSDGCHDVEPVARGSPKTWTQHDMDLALEALRNHHMSLTKASATYGIPSTTLWQRAHRLGIDTPKKEGSAKSWSEADLRGALHALRAGAISANKASKAYGIPSSTLYKIARREGIRLAAPFNAAPVSWRRGDLARALAAIRAGAASVQRAAAQYGIPSGTLYGRCKREGIELSRSNPTPWSEDAMGEALEAVRVGQMSINQAAIHYNLPYSSLYGRFKRCKYLSQPGAEQEIQNNSESTAPQQELPYYHQIPQVLEPDHIVQSYSHHDYVTRQQTPTQSIVQDPYTHAAQAMYCNAGFNGIATS